MNNAKRMAETLKPQVNNLLLAMATAQMERERVDKIARQVLSESEYMTNAELTRQPSERVTNPKELFLMRDEHFASYHAKMQAIHLANGYADAAKGYCPACVAEHLQTQAEWAVIEAAQEFFPTVDNDALLCGTKDKGGLETRREWLDLLIKIVVNAPGYQKPKLAA